MILGSGGGESEENGYGEDDGEDGEEGGGEAPEENGLPEGGGVKEAFFAPAEGDDGQLQALFDAFSRAAELNPDPPEPGAEDGDDNLIFDEASMAAAMAAMGDGERQTLQHLEAILQVPGAAVEGPCS